MKIAIVLAAAATVVLIASWVTSDPIIIRALDSLSFACAGFSMAFSVKALAICKQENKHAEK